MDEQTELIEKARDIIFTHDLEGNVLWVNEAAQQILGYTKEDAAGLNITRIVPPEYIGAIRQAIERAVSGALDPAMTVPVIAKDGSRRLFEVSGRVQFQDGKAVAVQGIGRDITERTREELRTLLAAVAECSDDAIITATTDGHILSWNAGAEKIFGYSAGEVLGETVLMLSPPERRHELTEMLAMLSRGEGVNHYETVRLTKGGESIHVLFTARPLKDSAGNITAVTTTVRDITFRKHAQEEIRRQKEFSEMLIQSSSDGIFAFDRDFSITVWNPAMERISGLGGADAIGKRVLDLLPFLRETGEEGRLSEALAGQFPISEGWQCLVPQTGHQGFYEVCYSPLSREGGEVIGALCAVRDVTKRTQAERERRRKHDQLRGLAVSMETAREGERKRIAREIHDELGQRLTVLNMNLSRLESELSKGPPALLRRVRERIQAMQELIETTLEWTGRICVELRPSILDNLGLTAAIQWQAQEFQTCTGIKCVFTRLAKGVTLDADRSTAVFRIFQELLTNVARHAAASTVRIKFENAGPRLVLQVKDDGKGIREEQIASPDSLGLLGIRERAEWLGGELDIRGAPGAGTTVTLKIPLEHQASAARAAKAGK